MAISVDTLAVAMKYAKSYTDAIIAQLPRGVNYIGAVNYYNNLPNNPEMGDAYTVKYQGTSGSVEDGTEYVWATYEGTLQWVPWGSDITRGFEKEDWTFTLADNTVVTKKILVKNS